MKQMSLTYHTWIRRYFENVLSEAKSYNELVALLEERNEPIGDELLDIPIKSTQSLSILCIKLKMPI